MKLDVKLDHFYKSVIDDATTKSASIIEDYKKQLSEMYAHQETELKNKQALTLKTACDNVSREKNKQLSSEAIRIRRVISEKKTTLKDSLFNDITAKIKDFMNTPAYDELLAEQISSAMTFANGESITIYLNASDASKKEDLERKTHASLTISTMDFMGGTRAVIHDKSILIDNSFVTKIADEKENFQF